MVAIKPQAVSTLLKRPDPSLTTFLVFGNDAGLVGERARALARALSDREQPAGELLRLDDTDLESDPDRLAVELLTMPMFGGRKVVRVTASRRVNAQLLKPLVQEPRLCGLLIVEAGALRPDESLRQLFERAPSAAAIACYGDEAADLETMAREVLKARQLAISPEAMELLVARLGADRAMSRGEVEKLATYALGQASVGPDDVEAVVGDAAAMASEHIIDAAALGDAPAAIIACQRLVAAGESQQGLLVLMQWHFARLHRARAAIDRGRPLDEVIRQMRPPLHFKRRGAVEAQCRRWSLSLLTQALARIRRASHIARVDGALEDAHVERLLMELARLAGSASRSGTGRATVGR